jgi:hypothetical protein
MSSSTPPTPEEIAGFAQRYGLGKLDAHHLERMRELSVYVSDLGGSLPRVTSKEAKPAPFAARWRLRDV